MKNFFFLNHVYLRTQQAVCEWALSTVYVKKKSKEICVCADFSTGLNNKLKDYHYPLSSPEEIFTKLRGRKIFSKINLSDTNLQIPVNEECSKLLCINTYRGLFKLFYHLGSRSCQPSSNKSWTPCLVDWNLR